VGRLVMGRLVMGRLAMELLVMGLLVMERFVMGCFACAPVYQLEELSKGCTVHSTVGKE
jgi:hypothetical protein